MIRRQLTDHMLRGATVLSAMAATLAVASAFTHTSPSQPLLLVVPAAQAAGVSGTVVVLAAEDTVDGGSRPELRVRRSLTWDSAAPVHDLAAVQLSGARAHQTP